MKGTLITLVVSLVVFLGVVTIKAGKSLFD